MSVVIKECSLEVLLKEPNFSDLLERYADELALEGLPRPKAKIEIYRRLEELGKIHFFAAYIGDLLVGIINVLMSENPHYGISIAMIESYFVFKEFRKSGAGLLLRKQAEDDAKKSGSPALIISAQISSNLDYSLEDSKGYKEMTRTHYKVLA